MVDTLTQTSTEVHRWGWRRHSASRAQSNVYAVLTPEPQLHERLRDLLSSAKAETSQVVATFLDIRSFSTFSERGESFDSATYLSSAYSRILSDYFPAVDFFKPTGDGLMLIHQLPSSRVHDLKR